jgi:hypothetical protein
MIVVFGRAVEDSNQRVKPSRRPAFYRLGCWLVYGLLIYGVLLSTEPVVGLICGVTAGLLLVTMFAVARKHASEPEALTQAEREHAQTQAELGAAKKKIHTLTNSLSNATFHLERVGKEIQMMKMDQQNRANGIVAEFSKVSEPKPLNQRYKPVCFCCQDDLPFP